MFGKALCSAQVLGIARVPGKVILATAMGVTATNSASLAFESF